MELTILIMQDKFSSMMQTMLITTHQNFGWNNTFHGMGMIATVTPANKKSNQILRVKVTPKDIAAIGRVPIRYHSKESVGMTMVTYEKLCSFKGKDPTANLDLL